MATECHVRWPGHSINAAPPLRAVRREHAQHLSAGRYKLGPPAVSWENHGKSMGNSWGFPWILSITSRTHVGLYGILHTLRLFSELINTLVQSFQSRCHSSRIFTALCKTLLLHVGECSIHTPLEVLANFLEFSRQGPNSGRIVRNTSCEGFDWMTHPGYGLCKNVHASHQVVLGNFVGGAPFIIVGMVWIFSWEYERNSSDLYAMFHGIWCELSLICVG